MALPQEILERLQSGPERSAGPVLAPDWPALGDALPDAGFPRGVVEVRAPHALAGATTIAIAAVRAAQRRDPRAWAAWIDPEGTLHAPGLAQRGVDLGRLVVARPERRDLARIATKVVTSGAFEVVVVDVDPVGTLFPKERGSDRTARRVDALFVRRLALGAERSGSTVLLLSDAHAQRREPWPVALRLELERDTVAEEGRAGLRGAVLVRVGKERHGRVGHGPTRVPLEYEA